MPSEQVSKMKTVFTNELKPLFDALSEQMELYVPTRHASAPPCQHPVAAGPSRQEKTGDYYTFNRYDPSAETPAEFNSIRACTPVKEFLFPLRELAALLPEPFEPEQIKPFAVFGLKECDLRSIEILDRVFVEEEFEDPFYVKRRENMFIIASDCSEAGESCFCNILGIRPFAESGFDLNISKIKDGFIVEAGSQKGQGFMEKHSQDPRKAGSHPQLFSDATEAQLAERDENRAEVQKQLEQKNADLRFDAPIKEIVENSQDSGVFDDEAKNCVECQACTRICPTCHCFTYTIRSKKITSPG